jgi:hypothetical protein
MKEMRDMYINRQGDIETYNDGKAIVLFCNCNVQKEHEQTV